MMTVEKARTMAAAVLTEGFTSTGHTQAEFREAASALRFNALLFTDDRPDTAGAMLCDFAADMFTLTSETEN